MENNTKDFGSVVSDVPYILRLHGSDICNVNFRTHVAGTTFVKNSNKVLEFLKYKVDIKNVLLFLKREPDNPYDNNAVSVWVSTKGSKTRVRVGYVPKDNARIVSFVLNNKKSYQIQVHDLSFYGGTNDKPNIGLFFSYNIQMII